MSFNVASAANNSHARGDRDHPICRAVEKQQVFIRIDCKATRIYDEIIIVECSAQGRGFRLARLDFVKRAQLQNVLAVGTLLRAAVSRTVQASLDL